MKVLMHAWPAQRERHQSMDPRFDHTHGAPREQPGPVLLQHGQQRRVLHLLHAELGRVLALGIGQDHLVEHRPQRERHRYHLVVVAKEPKVGVGAPEGDPHQHVEELVKHEN
eukprot:6119777-Prymnesium_polylepis.2